GMVAANVSRALRTLKGRAAHFDIELDLDSLIPKSPKPEAPVLDKLLKPKSLGGKAGKGTTSDR
ncbi:MAG: hypothetical protein L0Y60_14405, partial [Beijerinckiaceae bacterium]|nr:hypothetical protein [Beijerinckiaceae bacterium]